MATRRVFIQKSYGGCLAQDSICPPCHFESLACHMEIFDSNVETGETCFALAANVSGHPDSGRCCGTDPRCQVKKIEILNWRLGGSHTPQ